MTTGQLGTPVDPKLVLAGVDALRWRMRQMLGPGWEPFRRRLDRLYTRAIAASGDKQERLVAGLLRFGLDSSVAEIFEAIQAHADSPAAMKKLVASQKTQEARESPKASQPSQSIGGRAEARL